MGILIAVMITVSSVTLGFSMLSQHAVDQAAKLSDGWKAMQIRARDMERMELALTTAVQDGAFVNLTVSNTGERSSAGISGWDLVVRYVAADDSYHVAYLTFTTSSPAGGNAWRVSGIFTDDTAATPEIFQRGILDPAEALIARLKLNPAAKAGGVNVITLGGDNGLSTAVGF